MFDAYLSVTGKVADDDEVPKPVIIAFQNKNQIFFSTLEQII